MTRARAVVIGAGIGGLASAAGLCAAGWEVTACERAASLEPVGAALALAPNGLRALDVFGAGDALRALAVPQELGIRRPDGRWLMRSTTGRMISDRFGDTIILLPRAAVIDALMARVPAGTLSLATEVTSVEPGGEAGPGRTGAARVTTTAGELAADLVVAADGIGSAAAPGVVPRSSGASLCGVHHLAAAHRPGDRTGSDGGELGPRHRLRCHAAVRAGRCTATRPRPLQPGARASDELAELVRLFGTWHEPIPALLAMASRAMCSAMMSPSWPSRCRPSTAAGSPCSVTPPIP